MSKGQLQTATQIFGLLFVGVVSIYLVYLSYGGFFNIRAIAEEFETERHAILQAQILMSLPNLTYSDNNTFYRAIFQTEKINSLMMKQSEFVSNWQEKLYPDLNLSNETGYPDSYLLITLLNLDANENWIAVVSGPQKKFNVNEFVKCLINNRICESYDAWTGECIAYVDMNKLFELGSGPWDVFNINTCVESFDSLYNVTVYYSKIGTSLHGFPVSIRISDEEINSALLRVWVAQA